MASLTFGVYLLQCHPVFWHHVIAGDAFCDYAWFGGTCFIFIAGLSLYVSGTLADCVRLLVFRILRVDKLASYAGNHIEDAVRKLVRKLAD